MSLETSRRGPGGAPCRNLTRGLSAMLRAGCSPATCNRRAIAR
jgi:hypothetical protein